VPKDSRWSPQHVAAAGHHGTRDNLNLLDRLLEAMSDSLKQATPDEASDADGPGGGAGGGPDAARASSAHAPEDEACVKPKKSGKRHVGLMTQFGLTGNETVVKLDGKVAAFITDASLSV